MGKGIFLPVIGLVFLLAGCQSFQSPQFRRVKNLSVVKWDFSHPVVAADVVFYNPNNIGFDFRGAEVDVHLDSLWLGHSEIDNTVHIPPHSEFVITLPIELNLQQLLKEKLQSYLNRQVDVRVNGTVRGSKAGIVRKFPIEYEGKQELDLKLF